ncbi:MAG: acyltransferase [Bacteroidales bacterium]
MLENHPKLKHFLHYLLIHPYTARPRLWVRWFIIPLIIKRGKGSIIRRKARLDIIPSKKFAIGVKTIIEDYVIVNNGMGNVIIGNYSKMLSRTMLVGPVKIGNKVVLGSNSRITGLTHNYLDVNIPIDDQGVTASMTTIEDDVWIGGNCCINQGLHIGTHVIIGAGSVVTKDIPSYCVAVGNPARVVKMFDFAKNEWVRPAKQ